MKRRYIALIIFALLGLISVLSLPALSKEGEVTQPLQLAQQGQEFYQGGQLDKAVEAWQKAADAYAKVGNREAMRESLLNKATAQQALGLYPRSCQTVLGAFGVNDPRCDKLIEKVIPLEKQLENSNQKKQVMSLVKPIAKQPNSLNKATGLLLLGDFLRESSYLQVSEEVLGLSLNVAQKLNSPLQESATLLSLGNTARAIASNKQDRFPPITAVVNIVVNQGGSVQAALEPYQQAINYYERAATEIEAQLNHLSILLNIKEYWKQATDEVIDRGDKLTIDDPSFRALVIKNTKKFQSKLEQELTQRTQNLVTQIRSEIVNLPTSRTAIYTRINFAQSLIRLGQTNPTTAEILATAAKDARTLNDSNAEAQALNLLGLLYQKNGQLQEAQNLTEKALRLAPATESPEIAYLSQTQLGQILQEKGDNKSAIAAYDAAFNTIKTLRSELAANTSVEPIYRQYVNLLLQGDPTQEELKKARDVLESLQIAELDNFFRDPCSVAAEEPVLIDSVDKEAAVIYAIVLSDRLEIILTLPGKDLRRYSTSISSREVNITIDRLRRQSLTDPGFSEQLRGARGNPQQEQFLQQSLQESLSKELLPLAQQVYDWLIRPAEASLEKNKVKNLVFVLDDPLRNIPMALLYDRQSQKYLIEKDYNIAVTSGLQLTASKPLVRQNIRVLAAGATRAFPELDFPPIPQVERELKLIGEIFTDSRVLLDGEFTEKKLQEQLKDSTFPVVHIATHGQFSSNPDETFIVSGNEAEDELINVNELDNLLRVRNTEPSNPIELLVLSACNTAEGDDRAILGLAGVAVRAGARSTLATLWAANDEATAELMGYFYQNLASNTNISKAQALRDAQLALFKAPDSRYKHPYYWTPFVLVGNWL